MSERGFSDSLRETLSVFQPGEPGEPLMTNEVADKLDAPRREVYDRLCQLVDMNRLRSKKTGAREHIWWRPPAARASAAGASVSVPAVTDETPSQPFAVDQRSDESVEEEKRTGGFSPADASGDAQPIEHGISQRRQQETDDSGPAHSEDREQFESLVATVREYAIFRLDENGHVRSWNAGAARLKRYEPDEIIGDHFSTFYTEDDHEAGVPERNLSAAKDRGWIEDEGWRVRKDGTQFWANVTITALRDDEGDLIGFTKITRDMTEQREYERRLHKERAFVESILQNQRDVIYAFDAEGQILRWNQELLSATGYTDDEVEAMEPVDFVSDSAVGRVETAVERVLDGESLTIEAPLVTADGEEIPYEFSATPLTGDADEVVGFAGIGRDISERKRQERELERQRHELENELFAVFDRIDDAFFALDEEWRFSHVNEQAAAVLDRSVGELIGSNIWEEFPDAVDSTFEEHYKRAAATQESVSFEAAYPPLDTWFAVTVYPSASGLSVYFRDISDRKERERRLERYEQLVEAVDDGIYALDTDDRFILVNEAFCDLTGYSREELIGAPGETVYGNDIGSQVHSMVQEIEAGEREIGHIEHDIETSDGEIVPCETRFDRFRIGDGSHGRCGVVRDISDRKAREQQLARFKQAVEASGHAIFMFDTDGQITYVNSAFEELTGFTATEVLGEDLSILRHGEHDDYYRELWKTVATGRTWEDEIVDRRKDGTIYYAEQTIAPVTDEDGEVVQYVAVQKDVTDRKEFEDRLTELNEASRELLMAEREPRVVSILIETVTDVFDLPACVVYAHNEATDRLVPMEQSVETGFFDGEFTDVSVADETLLARAFTEGSARYVGNVSEFTSLGVEVDTEETRCGTFIPLGDHGILTIGSREPFDENTRLLIELLAANAEAAWESVTRKIDLQHRIDQQETVTALGQLALGDFDPDVLMAEAATAVADVLDNEYCKVLELDADAGELLLRQGVGWDDDIVGEATISARGEDSQAAYTLQTDQPVVVKDLTTETRFSGPDLLTSHDVRGGISVVIGPPDDPWGILGSHDTNPRQFSEYDANFVQSVANILATAMEHHADQRVQTRQREELAALVSLNEVVREISDAVIDQSTCEEIETTVCERLAATDSYEFAWIGRLDHRTQTVELTAEAGVENYLEDVPITVDPDDDHSDGPTGRALRTGEIQTSQDVQNDPQYEPWHDQARAYGYQSSAAIPIEYDGTTYGVLNVYTERLNAFTGRERAVVAQVGEVVAHAMAAIERKRALMTDDVVELGFQITDFFSTADLKPADGTISLTDTVLIGDDQYVVYGTATGNTDEWLADIVDHLDHWIAIEYRDGGTDDERVFELQLDEPPVISTIASVGGSLIEAVIEDGHYYMTVQVPPGTGVRQVIDAVQEAYPRTEMISRQQKTRDAGITRSTVLELSEDLTDRQLAVLRAAYHAGFFEWPRESSGEEVADSLDVAAPTFHQHLRKAEKKVFDTLLETLAS